MKFETITRVNRLMFLFKHWLKFTPLRLKSSWPDYIYRRGINAAPRKACHYLQPIRNGKMGASFLHPSQRCFSHILSLSLKDLLIVGRLDIGLAIFAEYF